MYESRIVSSPRSAKSILVAGCVIALLVFTLPCSAAEPFRLAQVQLEENDGLEQGKSKAQNRTKTKEKHKQKAKPAGKSKLQPKQQPRKAPKSESEIIMKSGGGRTCPASQRALGSARRGGCM